MTNSHNRYWTSMNWLAKYCIHPSIHPSISINSHGSSRTATMSLIFLFHSSLLTVNWTTAGNVVPHQPMMSSTHLMGGHPLDLSPSTMRSITVYQSIIVHSTNISQLDNDANYRAVSAAFVIYQYWLEMGWRIRPNIQFAIQPNFVNTHHRFWWQFRFFSVVLNHYFLQIWYVFVFLEKKRHFGLLQLIYWRM